MRDTYFVAPAESGSVSFAQPRLNLRIAVLIAIVYVRPAVVLEVSPSSFQSIVKSATLDLVELARRNLPIAVLSVCLRLQQGLGVQSGC